MKVQRLADFRLGSILARYEHDKANGTVGLTLIPAARLSHVRRRRTGIRGVEIDAYAAASGIIFPAWNLDSLVQLKVTDDPSPPGFAQGRTMRNSGTIDRLTFRRQSVTRNRTAVRVRTTCLHAEGWQVHHDLIWPRGASWVESCVTVENSGRKPITLELLSSFSIGGITPFASDNAPGHLRLHRMRSVWSMEGRLETRGLEELQLERSWSGWGVRSERFGAVGSLPVCGFFPFAALEDTKAGVVWAAQLSHNGSWQMETYRRGDTVAFSGGLADRELGHWQKTLSPGATFTSPRAFVTTVAGSLDEACHALTAAQRRPLHAPERTLPVIFNEWATTWGKPSHRNMVALAGALRGRGIKYLVIDAGWYAPLKGDWGRAHGDWQPNADLYPDGLRHTADAIRAAGLVPGLWFEMETCGPESRLWSRDDLLLRRDGRVLTVGNRRFLDFRKKETISYLAERVIGQLRATDFGYLKVDYNDNIGIGVDGSESLGEGLRLHLAGVQDFFRQIHRELPHLVIENCSSGGHRLEPSMLALTEMSSFSDAHECREIPVIAANLHRLIMPHQSQIWAVIRAGEKPERTLYSLTAGFLGRLCLSGDFLKLSSAQNTWVDHAVALYAQAAPTIAHGRSARFGPEISSYRDPKGWQAVTRLADTNDALLVVAHTFGRGNNEPISIPLPDGAWRIATNLSLAPPTLTKKGTSLRWRPSAGFQGLATLLHR